MATPALDTSERILSQYSLGHFLVDLGSARLEQFPGHRPISQRRIDSLKRKFNNEGPIRLSVVKAIFHGEQKILALGGRLNAIQLSIFSGQHRAIALQEWCKGDPQKTREEGWWVFELFHPACMDALSGAFTVLTIKENLDDMSSTLPLVGEGDVFYSFISEPNKARFLELLNDLSTELAQDLQSLQKYPVCITALRSALGILPIRSNYNFRMLSFFMRYRMAYLYSCILWEAVEFWKLSDALDLQGDFIPVPGVHWFLHLNSSANNSLVKLRQQNVGFRWDNIDNGPQKVVPLAFDSNGKATWSFQEIPLPVYFHSGSRLRELIYAALLRDAASLQCNAGIPFSKPSILQIIALVVPELGAPHTNMGQYIEHRDGFLSEMGLDAVQLFEVVCFRECYRFKIPRVAALENVLQRVDRKKLLLLLDPANEEEYFDMASFLIVMASCDHPKVKTWLIHSPLVNPYQVHETTQHSLFSPAATIVGPSMSSNLPPQLSTRYVIPSLDAVNGIHRITWHPPTFRYRRSPPKKMRKELPPDPYSMPPPWGTIPDLPPPPPIHDLPLPTLSPASQSHPFSSLADGRLPSTILHQGSNSTQEWNERLSEVLSSNNILFIVGSGISTGAGLTTYRVGARLASGFEKIFDYSLVMADQNTRVNLWKWCRHVMETKEAALPAPPFHRLLNQLHRMKKLKGVITTNVDGLEYKEADMSGRRDISVPSELLNPESRKVLQLHGNVYTGLCIPGGCKVPLTSAQVGPLCTPMDPLPSQRHLWGIPCPNCTSNPNRKPRAASSGRVYRPDMIFFHDKERLQSDEELILLKELLGEAEGFSKPDLLVIAGTSLRIDGLSTIANSVAKTTKTLIINTAWEPPFTQLDTKVKWEQTDANAWAEEILNGVDCDMS